MFLYKYNIISYDEQKKSFEWPLSPSYFSNMQGCTGHWVIYITSPQSLIKKTFSYSLAQQL